MDRRRLALVGNDLPSDVLFQLLNRQFNGTSDYVDTGINLMSSDYAGQDWTICVHFTDSIAKSYQAVVFQNMKDYESPWYGITLQGNQNKYQVHWNAGGIVLANDRVTDSWVKIAIRHYANNNGIKVYWNFTDYWWYTDATRSYPPSGAVNTNLIIGGAYNSNDASVYKFYEGTIKEFTLYSRALTDAELESWTFSVEE